MMMMMMMMDDLCGTYLCMYVCMYVLVCEGGCYIHTYFDILIRASPFACFDSSFYEAPPQFLCKTARAAMPL